MKKKLMMLLILLVCISTTQGKEIELEPRIGISLSSYKELGVHFGGLASMGFTNKFYIQSGILLNTLSSYSSSNTLGVCIPVYLSYRIPIQNTILRLNAGPYIGFNPSVYVGASAEGGIEYRKIYMGISYSHELSGNPNILFGLSVGYKFKL